MVDTVHVGRHDDEPQERIEAARQGDVGVVEERAGVERDLEDEDGERRRAKRGHHAEFQPHREENLGRMEADAGRHVEFQVGMVHPVQPPEERHGMEEHVLEIDREVERENGDGDGEPAGDREGVQKAPVMVGGKDRHAEGDDGEGDANQGGVEHDEGEVVRPAQEARDLAPAPGRGDLPEREREQEADEDGGADRQFEIEERVGHGLPPAPRLAAGRGRGKSAVARPARRS